MRKFPQKLQPLPAGKWVPREEEDPNNQNFGFGKRPRNVVVREVKTLTQPKGPNLRTAQRPAEREANRLEREQEQNQDEVFREQARNAPRLLSKSLLHLGSPLTSVADDLEQEQKQESESKGDSQASRESLDVFFSYREPSEQEQLSESASGKGDAPNERVEKEKEASKSQASEARSQPRRTRSRSLTERSTSSFRLHHRRSLSVTLRKPPAITYTNSIRSIRQPTMNQNTTHARMPRPGEKGSPNWGGSANQVHKFVRKFEVAAEQAGLDEAEMRKQLGRYCEDPLDQRLLEKLPGFKVSWDEYKRSIALVFPEGNPDKIYSKDSIEELVRKTRKKKPFRVASDYAKYQRKFLKQASALDGRHALSADDQVRLFAKGFPRRTRERLQDKLDACYGNQTPPINEYMFEHWLTIVNRLIGKEEKSDSSSDEGSDTSDVESESDSDADDEDDSDDEDTKSKRRKAKHKKKKIQKSKKRSKKEVKKEESDESQEFKNLLAKMNNQTLQAVNQVTKTVQTLSQSVAEMKNESRNAPKQLYDSRAVQGPSGLMSGRDPNRRQYGCSFCGAIDGHYMRACLVLMKYKEDKKVKDDPQTGKLVMGTGEYIPATPYGTPLKQRVDSHIKAMQTLYQSYAMESKPREETYDAMYIETFFQNPTDDQSETAEDQDKRNEYDNWADSHKSEETAYDLICALEQYKDKVTQKRTGETSKGKPGGGNNQPPRSILKRPLAEVREPRPLPVPRIEEIIDSEPKKSIPEVPKQEMKSTYPSPAKYGSFKPAYKSPAEDPELIEEVKKMVSSANLSGITVRHLLAVSPVIRADLINRMRSQRVETHHLMALTSAYHQDRRIVGEKSLPLREAQVTFPNGTKEMAVLDDGSSIIVLRMDLWREVGSEPLIREESVTMECADTGLSQTIGMVRNLPMKMGNILLHVQAHVVEKAPYRLLLGRTFSALTGCTKHDDPNGDTLISITDPNNPSYTETLPTRPRLRPREPPNESFCYEDSDQGKGRRTHFQRC